MLLKSWFDEKKMMRENFSFFQSVQRAAAAAAAAERGKRRKCRGFIKKIPWNRPFLYLYAGIRMYIPMYVIDLTQKLYVTVIFS